MIYYLTIILLNLTTQLQNHTSSVNLYHKHLRSTWKDTDFMTSWEDVSVGLRRSLKQSGRVRVAENKRVCVCCALYVRCCGHETDHPYTWDSSIQFSKHYHLHFLASHCQLPIPFNFIYIIILFILLVSSINLNDSY